MCTVLCPNEVCRGCCEVMKSVDACGNVCTEETEVKTQVEAANLTVRFVLAYGRCNSSRWVQPAFGS